MLCVGLSGSTDLCAGASEEAGCGSGAGHRGDAPKGGTDKQHLVWSGGGRDQAQSASAGGGTGRQASEHHAGLGSAGLTQDTSCRHLLAA